jgi:hypothetical protein
MSRSDYLPSTIIDVYNGHTTDIMPSSPKRLFWPSCGTSWRFSERAAVCRVLLVAMVCFEAMQIGVFLTKAAKWFAGTRKVAMGSAGEA